ncbi:hypothetical protein DTO271D3_6136 [Paecilomyces variotii]|nr:hypothetical protein DTO195F2_3615 [Paecilomyces variotii]KAJ9308975.1 hypothetical protein DTO217A2_1651 [Paecilomyces variotii]KAJ9313632.1 hypothetical protein DTO271D3_6136 [Paecilomyces variotii]KAJ9368108.1 hypothetical protein DTO282E5_7224 [Paecilomyces variotii]
MTAQLVTSDGRRRSESQSERVQTHGRLTNRDRTTRTLTLQRSSLHRRAGRLQTHLTSSELPNLPFLPVHLTTSISASTRTMFLQRTAFAVARRTPIRAIAKRPFSSSIIRCEKSKYEVDKPGKIVSFDEVKTEEDLLPPGAKPGTIPTDLDQATGLERLELLGKMQGIDIFDMRPLDASRKGTLDNPIIVNGAGDEQYAGCTGYPADSHVVNWLTVSRERPIERCMECGNVIKYNYVGPEEDPHAHDHGHHHQTHEDPKTFADYVKPEYWYR